MKKLKYFIISLALPTIMYCQEGELDLSFNGNGKYILEKNYSQEEALDVKMQADGKLVMVGYTIPSSRSEVEVLRLDAYGNPDQKFGSQGIVETDFGTYESSGRGLDIQPDGKIIITGIAQNGSGDRGMGLVRLQSNGALDNSFGDSGRVYMPINGYSQNFPSVMVLPNGKIVVAGSYYDQDGKAILARFNANGQLDYTFADSGIATISAANSLTINRFMLKPDGRFIGAGFTYSNNRTAFVIVQFNQNGTPDASFGGNGISVINFPDYARAYGLALQSDGKIVVCGSVLDNGLDYFALVRLETDGTLDQSFGTNGKASHPILSNDAQAKSVHLMGDGKIIVAGQAYGLWNFDFAVARFGADGQIDLSFSLDGFVTKNIGSGREQVYNSLLQPNGRLVVVGSTHDDNYSVNNIAAARFLGGVGSIGNEEYSHDIPFSIYPNPASEWLRVESAEDVQHLKLRLIDGLGRTVGEWQGSAPQPELDVSHLSPGLYFLSISVNGRQAGVKKVMIEH